MDHPPHGQLASLRQRLHGKSQSVGELNQSPLSNHIGIVGMIETVGGYLLVQDRSSQIANRKNTASASVSGAMSLTNFRVPDSNISTISSPPAPRKLDLNESVLRTLRDECIEELRLDIHDIVFHGGARSIDSFTTGRKRPVGSSWTIWSSKEGSQPYSQLSQCSTVESTAQFHSQNGHHISLCNKWVESSFAILHLSKNINRATISNRDISWHLDHAHSPSELPTPRLAD